MSHVRSDRWYKLGRTILYGGSRTRARSSRSAASASTRTTPPASSAMRHPRPAPYGIVELTPEREYLLVTEFFAGAGGDR